MQKRLVVIAVISLGILVFVGQAFISHGYTPDKEKNTPVAEQTALNNSTGPQDQPPQTPATVEPKTIENESKATEVDKPQQKQKTAEKNTNQYSQYNNAKNGWGFTRNKDHQQPTVGWYGPAIAKYNGIYVGNPQQKKIYLTFDEGYENGYTPKILDVLRANNVKAHFFITAAYLKDQPELVKRMVAEGHVVGNHSVNHPSMPEVSTEQAIQEIQGLQEQLDGFVKYDMYLFRPPRGEWSERTLKITEDLGYKTVFWSMAYQDWLVDQQQGWERAYNHVMENIHNGAVILLHAVSSDNAEALDRIIKDLQKQGYVFSVIEK